MNEPTNETEIRVKAEVFCSLIKAGVVRLGGVGKETSSMRAAMAVAAVVAMAAVTTQLGGGEKAKEELDDGSGGSGGGLGRLCRGCWWRLET